MSLYRALLIDIIYSLRKDHLDNEQAESKLLDMDRQNLALNYGIAWSLIDIMFEILKDQPIKFNPNLRSRQDFLYAKEQISSLDTTIELDGFNPAITKEERFQIQNPIILRIILDQELEPQNADPEQSILFIHLMFLSFPELSQNNSIMIKRKYVLLKLFEQQPYSYQCQEQVYQFGKKPGIEDHTHNSQNHVRPNDQRMTSQYIQERSAQDLSIRSDQGMNQQCSQFFRLKQTGSKTEIQSRDLRQTSRINQIQFYFRSNYPIQIEQLSSHTIKMKYSKHKQCIYKWTQLDLSSFFNLMTTHTKAFHCWASMLKLLNGKQFRAFINNQLGDSESDDEKAANDDNQIEQLLINNDLKLDNIITIDNRQSIVKFPNKVIIIEQFKLERTLKSIEKQIETVNNLITKKNYLDHQIVQISKHFHIACTLDEWHQNQKQLVSKSINNETQSTGDAQLMLFKNQLISQPEFRNNKVLCIDKAIQTLFDPSMENKQYNNKADQFRSDQYGGYQQDNTIRAKQLMLKGVKQHCGQWKFRKQYPVQIENLTRSRLLMRMKDNEVVIVEWWQFDYDSLNNLFLEKVNLQAAEIWSVLLILIDEEQFFKLWKGEVIEQIQIKEEEEQQLNNQFQIDEEYNLYQLPETIISNDVYRFIIKLWRCVQILPKVELLKQYNNLIQEYEAKNEKIGFRPAFYKHKINKFRKLLLEQGRQRIKYQQTLPHQITHGQIKSNLLKVTVCPQSPTGLWIFTEDYPVRINLIDKHNFKLEFQDKIKNTTVKWEQLDYHSLIKLIEKRINIRAGHAWSIMLILLDHDQFYNLWKNYRQQNNKEVMSKIEVRQVKDNQQSVTSNKRDPPDYMPQRIIRLDEQRVIVKFQNYVRIFANEELTQYTITLEIPNSQFNKLRINIISAVYNQNIRAFQERLTLEEEQIN